MDWFASLPPELQKWLLDVAGKATASMVATLATRLVDASSNRLRRALQDDPKQAALQRALSQAIAAALSIFPLDDDLIEHYLSVFSAWLELQAVIDELTRLLEPGEENLDRELLRIEFEAAGFDPDWLGVVDFDAMLEMLVAGFVTAASREPELIEPLKIKLLEEMARRMGALERMEQLSEKQLAVGRQAVDELEGIRRIAQEIEGGQDRTNDLLQEIPRILIAALDQGVARLQAAFQTTVDALNRAGYHIEMDHAVAVAVGDGASVQVSPDLGRIEELLRQIHGRLATPAKSLTPDDLAEMEANYRRRVVEQFEILTFEGISASGTPIALPLEKVYVELKAVAEVPEAADTFSADERRLLLEAEGRGEDARAELALHLDSLRLERWRREAREQETRLQRRSIGDIVADPGQRGVVILGDPGSGKTTLLRYLALVNARKGMTMDGAPPDPRAPLPIFVPLAAYDECLRREGDCLPLGEFLALYFEKWRNLPGLGPLFAAALAEGRALVLLDGLDEVLDTGTRQFVTEQAGALIGQWASRGNCFAVTSRIVGYREARLPGDLPHVTVLDFGRPEIELFARQWCRTYEVWAASGKETQTALQRASAEESGLLDDVASNPSVERLAATPLLLTMLALLRRQVGRLPDRRVQLYADYVRTLMDNWEILRSRGARRQAPARFDPYRAADHLMDLALWLQRNKPSGTARRSDLETALEKICLRYEGLDPAAAPAKARVQAQGDATAFLRDVRHFAGLLTERGRDTFGFLHLTFQEYFAGRAVARMADDDRWTVIRPHLHNPRWREPILLCAGQLGVIENRRDLATDLASRILDAGSDHEPFLHRDLFLAADVTADDVGLSVALRDELAARLALLIHSKVPTVRDTALAGLAQGLRLGSAPARDAILAALGHAQLQYAALEAVSAVLGDDRDGRIRQAVTGKLKDRDSNVRRAAVHALAPLVASDAAARQVVIGKLEDGDWPMRRAAVRALAPLMISDAAARQAVTGKLQDRDRDVRLAVVQALAPLVASDTAARQAVTGKLEDGDLQVRTAAVQALAPLVASDAAARQAVTGKLEDGSVWVRRAAVQALAPLVASDAAARQAATGKLEDGSSEVRRTAVQALTPLVASDGRVRQAVTGKLEDGFFEVRMAAVQALAPLVASDAAARQAVTGKLEDSHDRVRRAAAQALAPLAPTDVAARQAVIGTLDDGFYDVRRAAVQALAPLVTSDAAARQAVAGKLEDASSDVRRAVVQALAPLAASDAAARQAVIGKLEDGDNEVRSAAVRALAPLAASDAAARQAVIARLKDGDNDVRQAAVQALAPLVASDAAARQAVTGKLEDGDNDVRREAVQALAPLVPTDPAARQAVIGRLEDGDSNVRRAAVQAWAPVVPTDAAARQAVTGKLEDGSIGVRLAAVQALAPLAPTDAAARQAVIGRLKDGEGWVRQATVQALAPLVASDAATCQAVIGRLADADSDVRRAAVEALAPLVASDAATCQAVIGRLADADSDVRRAAVEALTPLVASDTATRQAVTGKLEDRSGKVRRVAAQALAPLVVNDATPRQTVTGKLEDGDWQVRRAAVQALAPLVASDVAARGRLLPWLAFVVERRHGQGAEDTGEAIRRLLADAYAPLLASDTTLLAQVAAMLDNIAWPARQGAAWALIAMPGGPPPELLPKLRGLLDDMRGEESWPNRLQMAEMLVNDRDREVSRRAIAAAVEALDYATQPWYYLPRQGPEVRKQAATILGKLEPLYRDDVVFGRLVRVLDEDVDEEVRDAAYAALLRLAAAPEEKA